MKAGENYSQSAVRPQEVLGNEFDEEFEDRGGGGSSGSQDKELEEETEGKKPKAREIMSEPTEREIREHELTHLPFRSWCKHCVRGRAVNYGHHVHVQEDKDEQQVPIISVDYMYMKSSDQEETKEEGQPIMVMKDRKSKFITAHVIEEKGENPYAIKRLGQDIGMLGYNRIVLKSDGEPAIVALKAAVKRERREEIIMEESPVDEHQSNGEIENAVRQVQGMTRTIKSGLEEKIEKKIERNSPIIPWMVRHAAASINRYQIGKDGKTAHRRLRGKEFNRMIAEFGECVWYLKAKTLGKDKYESRWDDGVWLGIREESGEKQSNYTMDGETRSGVN